MVQLCGVCGLAQNVHAYSHQQCASMACYLVIGGILLFAHMTIRPTLIMYFVLSEYEISGSFYSDLPYIMRRLALLYSRRKGPVALVLLNQ